MNTERQFIYLPFFIFYLFPIILPFLFPSHSIAQHPFIIILSSLSADSHVLLKIKYPLSLLILRQRHSNTFQTEYSFNLYRISFTKNAWQKTAVGGQRTLHTFHDTNEVFTLGKQALKNFRPESIKRKSKKKNQGKKEKYMLKIFVRMFKIDKLKAILNVDD